jgi:hypothetical protein
MLLESPGSHKRLFKQVTLLAHNHEIDIKKIQDKIK